jgi:dethiobiotin synthetase
VAPRVWFVAGTDTGVGKTVVSAGLLRAAARRGWQTLAVKPVAAGCSVEGGRLVNDDALTLMREATIELDYAEVNPVALELAIAPHIAAARADQVLSVEALASHCRSLALRQADLVVIEGAGGWLVPLDDRTTLADLCQALEAPVILVVGMRLGCINHALLTVADVARRGLKLAGWVANCIEGHMPELEANVESLASRIPAPCLGRVPHVAHAANEDRIEVAAKSLDLDALS